MSYLSIYLKQGTFIKAWVTLLRFHAEVVLTGCGCSAMQQLKQTQNSVILRLTYRPQQFPLSVETPLCDCLPVQLCSVTNTRRKRKTDRPLSPLGETVGTRSVTQKQGSSHLLTQTDMNVIKKNFTGTNRWLVGSSRTASCVHHVETQFLCAQSTGSKLLDNLCKINH